MINPRALVLSFLLSWLFSAPSFAAGGGSRGGDYSLGFQLGVVNSSQNQMNVLIKRANTREGGISTSELNSAYEGALNFTYRFTGTIFALDFRPSYFLQTQSGSGTGGAFKYGIQGFTLFPIFRLYPLENDFMKFYMQLGLGYGRLSGTIEENDKLAPGHGKVDFAGDAFGAVVGLGAEFCMTPSQCFSAEGNYRYLNFERMLATGSSGGFDTTNGSLSQYGHGQEVELDGEDLSARMGGLVAMLGYNYWF